MTRQESGGRHERRLVNWRCRALLRYAGHADAQRNNGKNAMRWFPVLCIRLRQQYVFISTFVALLETTYLFHQRHLKKDSRWKIKPSTMIIPFLWWRRKIRIWGADCEWLNWKRILASAEVNERDDRKCQNSSEIISCCRRKVQLFKAEYTNITWPETGCGQSDRSRIKTTHS